MFKKQSPAPGLLKILPAVAVMALVQLACSLVAPRPTPTPAPTPTLAAAATQGCPALLSAAPKPSGLIAKVTLAESTSGDQLEPVSPSVLFTPSSTIHAVAAIKDAPDGTAFKAVWYALDTHGAVGCNLKIQEHEVQSGGTRNIDFSLSPEQTWPVGTYAVEIYTGGALDQVAYYSVR